MPSQHRAALFAAAGLTLLFGLTAGTAWAASGSVAFKETITNPHPTSFDISFVENSTGRYLLAESEQQGG